MLHRIVWHSMVWYDISSAYHKSNGLQSEYKDAGRCIGRTPSFVPEVFLRFVIAKIVVVQ